MTTINTSADLLRLLREEPDFYEEARRLILSEELIALPERFAALSNRVDNFIGEQRQFNDEQREFNERTDQFIDDQRQFSNEQRHFNDNQRQFNERTDRFIDEQRQFNDDQRQFNKEQRRFNEEQRQFNRRLETGVGDLRGDQAYRACKEWADDIAEAQGFIVIDIISGLRLRNLFRSNPPPDVSHGDRRSFYVADLIMRVEDQHGNPAYLAVEASFTADARDTERALRNAAYLRHITGLPAHAAIASRQNDHRIAELLDGANLLWYQLPEEAFRPH